MNITKINIMGTNQSFLMQIRKQLFQNMNEMQKFGLNNLEKQSINKYCDLRIL